LKEEGEEGERKKEEEEKKNRFTHEKLYPGCFSFILLFFEPGWTDA